MDSLLTSENSYISKLILTNFRNYKNASFTFSEDLNVIYGKNGVGKTNILESISLLSPGRGFRSANIPELSTIKESAHVVDQGLKSYEFQNLLWCVYTKVENHSFFNNVSVFANLKDLQEETYKKNIQLNDKIITEQGLLNNVSNVIWLTPQMNQLFNAPSSTRRKFLDRIVYLIDSSHCSRVAKYEKLLRERIKILSSEFNYDKNWVTAVERKIAELGVAIAASRNETLMHLNRIFSQYNLNFPVAKIYLEGYFEKYLEQGNSALSCEEEFIRKLYESRNDDAMSKRSNVGVHKSDMKVVFADKNLEARHCSTGEQKLLLISITLAKALMCNVLNKARPILLLDEVCSYLDEEKRSVLFRELIKLNTQCFMTGIQKNIFVELDETNKEIKYLNLK